MIKHICKHKNSVEIDHRYYGDRIADNIKNICGKLK